MATNQTRLNDDVGQLPYKVLRNLAGILDIPGSRDWRALIAEMPSATYSRAQINYFEQAVHSPGRSPAMALLTDFGHRLLTVAEFISYLEAIDNQEALLLLKPHEPVVITTHPSPVVLQEGQTVTLTCTASGFPLPLYQWFRNRVPVPGACQSRITLRNVTLDSEGNFYCKVTNALGSEYTRNAYVQVCPTIAQPGNHVTWNEASYPSVTPTVDDSMIKCLSENPMLSYPANHNNDESVEESAIIHEGHYFVLKSPSNAHTYQWYKNGYPLANACSRELIFNPFKAGDEGYYTCKICFNGQEMLTHRANLKLADVNMRGGERIPTPNREFATGKVALVVANQSYINVSNESHLIHPIDDGKLLSDNLQSIGFKVIFLVDLTRKELEAAVNGFCSILKCTKGLYSLFYFCGHGFEEGGKTYLVAVNARKPWNTSCATSADYILSEIQQCRSTKLDVMLLDVCRVPSGGGLDNNNLSINPFIPGSQCITAFATCPQSQAFEGRRDRNGIYMKHLARHITKNMKVDEMLFKVGADVREEAKRHPTTSSMSPTYNVCLTKNFSLCDNILPFAGFVEGECDPTVMWLQYHRLPGTQILTMDLGIVVEIRFQYVCSNVCYCVVRLQSKGFNTWCEATIDKFTDDLDTSVNSLNNDTYSQGYSSKGSSFNTPDSPCSTNGLADSDSWKILEAVQQIVGTCTVHIKVSYKETETSETKEFVHTKTLHAEEFGIISFFNT